MSSPSQGILGTIIATVAKEGSYHTDWNTVVNNIFAQTPIKTEAELSGLPQKTI